MLKLFRVFKIVSRLREVLANLRRLSQRFDTLQQQIAALQEQLRAGQESHQNLLGGIRYHLDNTLIPPQLEAAHLAILSSDPKYSDPRRLHKYEFKVFSQFGEDGALQEIFRRIGTTNRRFVEFGAEAGLENNTAYLLLQGWSGLWIEPVQHFVSSIRGGLAPLLKSGRLQLLQERVTAANVEQLFNQAGTPREPDLLSIDIDGNDYWVWERIEHFAPRVVVIEYNALFPPPAEWVMPYEPDYCWNGTAKQGASLESLAQLGAAKGYTLVGCTVGGANALFVRQDLVGDHFAGPFTAANHYQPARYFFLSRHVGHPRCYEVLAAAAQHATPERGCESAPCRQAA